MPDTSNNAEIEYSGRVIVPFEGWHIQDIEVQENDDWIKHVVGDVYKYAEIMRHHGPCFTLLKDNKPIAISGLCINEEHRATAWSVISKNIDGTDLLMWSKELKSYIEELGLQRREMAVAEGFDAGERWAKILGFELEGLMKSYFPNGDNAHLYARIS